MSVPEGGYHNSKTKTTSCDKCISEHIVSRQKVVENRNTRRGDKNIVHWQYDFDRSTSLSRHWNDIYPILLGMIDDKNINLHKLKSGYMPSDVNNKLYRNSSKCSLSEVVNQSPVLRTGTEPDLELKKTAEN